MFLTWPDHNGTGLGCFYLNWGGFGFNYNPSLGLSSCVVSPNLLRLGYVFWLIKFGFGQIYSKLDPLPFWHPKKKILTINLILLERTCLARNTNRVGCMQLPITPNGVIDVGYGA